MCLLLCVTSFGLHLRIMTIITWAFFISLQRRWTQLDYQDIKPSGNPPCARPKHRIFSTAIDASAWGKYHPLGFHSCIEQRFRYPVDDKRTILSVKKYPQVHRVSR